MRELSFYWRVLAVAAAIVAAPSAALAQGEGRFTGTVLDPSGAAVPAAAVVARNERTGAERTAVTNADGRYVIAALKPSTYTLRVSVDKFAPLEFTGMQLAAAQEFPLDLTLQAAGVTEAVVVKGSATAMDVSSARIGVNVTEREVLTLGRSYALVAFAVSLVILVVRYPAALFAAEPLWEDGPIFYFKTDLDAPRSRGAPAWTPASWPERSSGRVSGVDRRPALGQGGRQ